MRSLIQDKRGDIFQILFMLIIMFVIVCVGLLFFVLSYKTTEAWEKHPDMNNTILGQKAIQKHKTSLPHFFDELNLFVFLGMIIALIIGAAKTNFNPGIIFIFLLLLAVAILNAAGFVNIYHGLASDSSVSDLSSKLTFTNIIFSKYTPLFFAVIGAIILIVMYSKSGSDIIR